MANTANFRTDDGTLGPNEGAWTEVITGPKTNSSDMEVASGAVEYIEATASSTPAASLVGKKLLQLEKAGESQSVSSLASGQAVFARTFGKQGAVLVVTPASS